MTLIKKDLISNTVYLRTYFTEGELKKIIKLRTVSLNSDLMFIFAQPNNFKKAITSYWAKILLLWRQSTHSLQANQSDEHS